ncbi:MAG TPA: MATE family efflux transporter [Clostridiales bacterium]|nr:MATE family efflux transporter [Clostridiales bacterium]
MKNISNDMETMPINKLAFKISIPMVISMISIALYGIVDTMFISKISNNALTAAALSIPVQSIITAIALGTSIGLNALLAKTLGEKNEGKTKSIIKFGFIVTFISWVVIVIASKLSLHSFFGLFTQNENIKKLGNNYLSIISLFSIWSLYQILFEKILEAYGKTKSSMIIQFGGAIINLILDPILIFGYFGIPALGISGAAISSVIGQFIGMMIGMIIILKDNIFTLNELLKLKIEKSIFKDIYKVGLPTMILESVASFITLILNKVLGEFSDNAISVWGIYCQLQKFVIIIVYGFNYGMIPIIAYNWGAKNKQRVFETIKTFLKISVGVTLIGELVFLLGTKQIIQIYNVPDDIFNVAIPAFRILAIGFIFAGISLTLSATFQALGNGLYSLIVNLSRQIIFTLPFIILLKKLIGINGIWISFTIAEIFTMIIAIILYLNTLKKVLNTLS